MANVQEIKTALYEMLYEVNGNNVFTSRNHLSEDLLDECADILAKSPFAKDLKVDEVVQHLEDTYQQAAAKRGRNKEGKVAGAMTTAAKEVAETGMVPNATRAPLIAARKSIGQAKTNVTHAKRVRDAAQEVQKTLSSCKSYGRFQEKLGNLAEEVRELEAKVPASDERLLLLREQYDLMETYDVEARRARKSAGLGALGRKTWGKVNSWSKEGRAAFQEALARRVRYTEAFYSHVAEDSANRIKTASETIEGLIEAAGDDFEKTYGVESSSFKSAEETLSELGLAEKDGKILTDVKKGGKMLNWMLKEEHKAAHAAGLEKFSIKNVQPVKGAAVVAVPLALAYMMSRNGGQKNPPEASQQQPAMG